jgi:hypothetical protein
MVDCKMGSCPLTIASTQPTTTSRQNHWSNIRPASQQIKAVWAMKSP